MEITSSCLKCGDKTRTNTIGGFARMHEDCLHCGEVTEHAGEVMGALSDTKRLKHKVILDNTAKLN